MQNTKDYQSTLANLPFWNKLSGAEAELLLSGTKSILYKQGDNIHSPSNECIGVLLVRLGELRTYILSESGKEVTLFRLREGGLPPIFVPSTELVEEAS